MSRPNELGQLVVWGDNNLPRTTKPPNTNSIVAIAAGGVNLPFSLALQPNGTVLAWGDNSLGQCTVPAEATNVVSIAAGYSVGLAVRADGTVVQWGNPFFPRKAGLTGIVQVAASGEHALALKADGTVTGWGADFVGQLDIPSGLSNVISVAAGATYSIALKDSGELVTWGGAPAIPHGLSNIVAISVSYFANVALRNDGTAVAWGQTPSAQMISLQSSNNLAVAAGPDHLVTITKNGAVSVILGIDTGVGSGPDELTNVFAIATGATHALALIGGKSEIARAKPRVINGFVVGIDVTYGGDNYAFPPTVLIVGGGGNGATAIAHVDGGKVSSITVLDAGFGYTSDPDIRIAAPPFAPSITSSVARVQLDIDVTANKTYQVEKSSDLNTWLPVADPFTATSEHETFDADLASESTFFRLSPK